MRVELCYDHDALQAEAAKTLEKCTDEQRAVVEKCMDLLSQGADVPKLICIDSPAGGGKTFLLNLLLSIVRGVRGEIALASASTGIAAMLLAGGTTAHSRFGIPVPVAEESVSTITVTSQRAEVIREATMLIWDEISMADKRAVECADALCREIMRHQDQALESVPFGGKLMIFAGDWRQLLPVVVRGGRAQVVNTCMKRSTLWEAVEVMKLTRNMRVEALGEGSAAGQQLRKFSKWLLDIGEGRSGEKVKVPEDMAMDFEDEQAFIDDVFPNLAAGGNTLNAAILLPLAQVTAFFYH
jgi:ATP-dependent DNA helicase PIF1